MTALERSVIEMYETHNMSVEEIASEEGLETNVVRSIIAANGENSDEVVLVDKHEIKDYIQAYKSLAYSDEAHIKERVLRNLINFGTKVTDGLGANDPKKVAAMLGKMNRGVNILELNKALNEIRMLRRGDEPPKQLSQGEIIDVETTNATE